MIYLQHVAYLQPSMSVCVFELCIQACVSVFYACCFPFLFLFFYFPLFYYKYTMTLFLNHMLAFHIIAEIKFDDFMWTNLRKQKIKKNTQTMIPFDYLLGIVRFSDFFFFAHSSSSICSLCFLPQMSLALTHFMHVYKH